MNDETVTSLETEIRAAQDDLGRHLDTLVHLLPPRDRMVTAAAIALAVTGAAWVALSRRARRRRRRREERRLERIVRQAVQEAGR